MAVKNCRAAYLFQATSGESERHLSNAGLVVTDRRSSLDSDSVEALVILGEAAINDLWP